MICGALPESLGHFSGLSKLSVRGFPPIFSLLVRVWVAWEHQNSWLLSDVKALCFHPSESALTLGS